MFAASTPAFSSYSSSSKRSHKSGSEDLKIYTPNNFHNGLHINPGPQHCHNNTISREYIPVKTPLRDVFRNTLSGMRLTQMHRFKCPPRVGAKIGPGPRCANSFSAGVGELWEVGLLAWQMDKGIASSMPSTQLSSAAVAQSFRQLPSLWISRSRFAKTENTCPYLWLGWQGLLEKKQGICRDLLLTNLAFVLKI